MRESPSFDLMDQLAALGGQLDYFDPHIPEVTATREHAQWMGKRSIDWSAEAVAEYDCVLIVTNHRAFDLEELVGAADLIVDTRNAIVKAGLETEPGQLIKA